MTSLLSQDQYALNLSESTPLLSRLRYQKAMIPAALNPGLKSAGDTPTKFRVYFNTISTLPIIFTFAFPGGLLMHLAKTDVPRMTIEQSPALG